MFTRNIDPYIVGCYGDHDAIYCTLNLNDQCVKCISKHVNY